MDDFCNSFSTCMPIAKVPNLPAAIGVPLVAKIFDKSFLGWKEARGAR